MRSLRQKKLAFTLIEILMVVIIIGILAAALIPKLQSVLSRARDVQRKGDLRTIKIAIDTYYMDYSIYPQAKNSSRSISYNADGSVFSVDNVFSVAYSHPVKKYWIEGLDSYITGLPIDPLNTVADDQRPGGEVGPWYEGDYIYSYGNVTAKGQPKLRPEVPDNRDEYALYGQLENPGDPDRNEARVYKIRTVYYMYPGLAKNMFSPNIQWTQNH